MYIHGICTCKIDFDSYGKDLRYLEVFTCYSLLLICVFFGVHLLYSPFTIIF